VRSLQRTLFLSLRAHCLRIAAGVQPGWLPAGTRTQRVRAL
jgi:hypothetical protein